MLAPYWLFMLCAMSSWWAALPKGIVGTYNTVGAVAGGAGRANPGLAESAAREDGINDPLRRVRLMKCD